jgi:hypothetical protein
MEIAEELPTVETPPNQFGIRPNTILQTQSPNAEATDRTCNQISVTGGRNLKSDVGESSPGV